MTILKKKTHCAHLHQGSAVSFKRWLEFLHFYPSKHFVIPGTPNLNSWEAEWVWYRMPHSSCNSGVSEHV